jgi:preprotein translocase subunit SecY
LSNCAIGALGIMPYISATIILQLLTAVMAEIEQAGARRRRPHQNHPIRRYLTVLLVPRPGLVFCQQAGKIPKNFSRDFPRPAGADYHIWWYRIQTTVIMMTTGTMLLMWLGEQITERGIGNGVSLIITIGIVARCRNARQGLEGTCSFPSATAANEPIHTISGHGPLLLILLAVVIGGVIAITQAQRKIPGAIRPARRRPQNVFRAARRSCRCA